MSIALSLSGSAHRASAYWVTMTKEQTGTSSRQERVQIEWSRVIAGALAAVVSAVVLSTLGAAGTLIGAAIGSTVATVGSALFTQGIVSSRRRLADAQAAVTHKVGTVQAEGRVADPEEENDEAAIETAPVGWRARLAQLPWPRVLLVSLLVFVVAMVAITVFELIAGRSVSSITGGSDGTGTTIGKVVTGQEDDGDHDDDQPSTPPSQAPTGPTTPSTSDGAQPTGSPTEGTTPTGSPTTTPTGSPTESAPPAEGTEPAETPSAQGTGSSEE